MNHPILKTLLLRVNSVNRCGLPGLAVMAMRGAGAHAADTFPPKSNHGTAVFAGHLH